MTCSKKDPFRIYGLALTARLSPMRGYVKFKDEGPSLPHGPPLVGIEGYNKSSFCIHPSYRNTRSGVPVKLMEHTAYIDPARRDVHLGRHKEGLSVWLVFTAMVEPRTEDC